jgi:hypothetical protein
VARDQLGERHRLAFGVRELDPDHAPARDSRHSGGEDRHVAGNVVGELDDPARLDPARRLELVHRDDGARADLHDLALDRKIFEHGFQQSGVALEAGFVEVDVDRRWGRIEQVNGRQGVAVAQRQRGLPLSLRPSALVGSAAAVSDDRAVRLGRSDDRGASRPLLGIGKVLVIIGSGRAALAKASQPVPLLRAKAEADEAKQ